MDVVDPANPWRYLQIRGHVVEIRPDDDLAFIDGPSRRYRGLDYAVRDKAREIYVIEIGQVKSRRSLRDRLLLSDQTVAE